MPLSVAVFVLVVADNAALCFRGGIGPMMHRFSIVSHLSVSMIID